MILGAASSVDISTLKGYTRFLTDTISNVASFSDANIIAVMNIEYRSLQAFLLSKVMNDWKENTLEGTGNGLINLVDGTNNYSFPTDLLTIDQVEINYTGVTNGWVLAEPMKLGEMGEAVANTANDALIRGSASSPLYWVRNGKIYLDPIPAQSVTSGLKVYCTILITDLASENDMPVFAKPFHEILAYATAERYLKGKEQWKRADSVEKDKNERIGKMIAHYSARDSDRRIGIRPKYRSFK